MSSPPKSSPSKSSVHQKLSLLQSSSSSSSKPFIKNKSQTTTSLHFPSFRFSPDSEEIEEITDYSDAVAEPPVEGAAGGNEDSTESSSTTGGDISPLKEYILKHKWANKWDKRSLSLDLDLKGKIITAIEDKRRSFVSHFYNEEDEEEQPSTSITSSHSIPDQLSQPSAMLHDDEEDISVHSDSVLSHGNRLRLNFDEENCTDYFELYPHQQPVLASPVDPDDLIDLVVEEIGVEAEEDDMMEDTSLLRDFVLPPEQLIEDFDGLPCLYQPPSLMKGLRKYPGQQVASGMQVVPKGTHSSSSSEDDEVAERKGRPISVKSLMRKLILDLLYSNLTRYWLALLAVAVAFDFGRFIMSVIWFLLGAGGTLLCWNVLGGVGVEEEREESAPHLSVAEMDQLRREEKVLEKHFMKSQGWMLTLANPQTTSPDGKPSTAKDNFNLMFPMYDAFNFHLRGTRTVFVRLQGPILIISNPHSKHRVPKRRLWNDPEISTDHVFMRHQQFNLYGAKIEIVPHGLAKKRVFCKKYPIAITLATKNKYCGKLTSLNNEENKGSPGGSDEINGDKSHHQVTFKDGSVKLVENKEKFKGEVYKEDGNCTGRTIYLFARTDREKDDWYRRFVAASKLQMSFSKPPPNPVNLHFLTYMKNACPNLHISTPNTPQSHSLRSTPTNELFESKQNVAVGGTSPASSRKTTPEKELSSSVGEFMTPTFLNAFVARLFYDFLKSPKWTHEVKQLIDRKLFFIRKPAFVQSLKVKELTLGDAMPITTSVSAPVMDAQGLWIDLEISYVGNMVITLEAFVNFLKLGANNSVERDLETSNKRSPSAKGHAMFDSDADDSGESSESDEDDDLEEDLKPTESKMSVNKDKDGQTATGAYDNRSKLMKYADTLSKSSVMRNKHVQKMVTGIAATPFVLTVEIRKVAGSLALNIPPVPNDRVWIGFRGNPEIEINVRPKVGERVVSLSHLTKWIKKKILLEFQRVMVSPNFMDVTIPLMHFELPK